MSLFEDNSYIYRDTFFIYFDKTKRPSADKVQATLAGLGPGYETINLRESEGELESITVSSPHDFSAMDITYVEGDEVSQAIHDVMEEFRTMTLAGDDQKKLARFSTTNARFDIFHFEKMIDGGQDEFIDPGGLLVVLEALAGLCDGISLDPQSHTLL